MNSKYMDWLNQNRNRAYPLVQDKWRENVDPQSMLDCALLDALVVNVGINPEVNVLFVKSIWVDSQRTRIVVRYRGSSATIELSGGDVSGPGSFEVMRGIWGDSSGVGCRVPVTLVFSSHAYLRSVAGDVHVDFDGEGVPVVPSRHVNLTEGHGVSGIVTNGSLHVQGGGVATGDVLLEDGYRTSPVVVDNSVVVRTGTKYGFDPCHYPSSTQSEDCSRLLFFFCGQNGVNSGNVNINGGRGITVEQGREYGGIPCVEIKADKELIELYTPN